MSFIVLFVLWRILCISDAFLSIPMKKLARTSLFMEKADVQLPQVTYPVKIKDIISTKGLFGSIGKMNNKEGDDIIARISIDLPPGVVFGVEKEEARMSNGLHTLSSIEHSNREASRVINDIFSMFESTTVIVFPTDLEVKAHKTIYPNFKGRLVSLQGGRGSKYDDYGNKKKRKKTADGRKLTDIEEEIAALSTSETIAMPYNPDIVIIVGAKGRDYDRILNIEKVLTGGQESLVVLLNCRHGNDDFYATRSSISNNSSVSSNSSTIAARKVGDMLDNVYQNIFCYYPIKVAQTQRDYLLYHAQANEPYFLAEVKDDSSKEGNKNIFQAFSNAIQSVVGSQTKFRTIWSGKTRPTIAEITDIAIAAAET